MSFSTQVLYQAICIQRTPEDPSNRRLYEHSSIWLHSGILVCILFNSDYSFCQKNCRRFFLSSSEDKNVLLIKENPWNAFKFEPRYKCGLLDNLSDFFPIVKPEKVHTWQRSLSAVRNPRTTSSSVQLHSRSVLFQLCFRPVELVWFGMRK